MHVETDLNCARKCAPPIDLLERASLFLDFDGTLVELADHPEGIEVTERLDALLALLAARLEGRLAIVSGRPAEKVLALVGSGAMTVVGSHGLEFHFSDGRVSIADRPSAVTEIHESMEEFRRTRIGVLVEDKPLGAALTPGAPQQQRPGMIHRCH